MAYFSEVLGKIETDIKAHDFSSVDECLKTLEGYTGELDNQDIVSAANAIKKYNDAVTNIKTWLHSNKLCGGRWPDSDRHMDDINNYLKTAQSECRYFEEILVKLFNEGKLDE